MAKRKSKTSAQTVSGTGAPSGYSGTPLVKKLGIKNDFVVALVNAPPEFPKLISDLPEGVSLRHSARGKRDLTIWFVPSLGELNRRIAPLSKAVNDGAIWMAWPKKASGVQTDVSESLIRQAGLDHELVDFKICAIDEIWSGLKFCRRKKKT